MAGGSGTQSDPYLIETVEEFRGMNDRSAYYKLAKDLDVNDSEWAGEWTQAAVTFTELDGDGRCIKNILYQGTDTAVRFGTNNSAHSALVKNLNFFNTMLRGNTSGFAAPHSSAYDVVFDGCEIACEFILTGAFSLFYQNITARNCGFNFRGKASQINLNYTSSKLFTGCSFKIDFEHSQSGSYFLHNGTLSNCELQIKLNGAAIATSGYYHLLYGSSFYNTNIHGEVSNLTGEGPKIIFGSAVNGGCYSALSFKNVTGGGVNFAFGALNYTSFYDKETAGITLGSQANVHALTTAQCMDKDYLYSIGFLID